MRRIELETSRKTTAKIAQKVLHIIFADEWNEPQNIFPVYAI